MSRIARHRTANACGPSRRPRATLLVGLVATALLVPTGAQAQDASEIFHTALQKYEERSRGIDDYTLVQEIMGIETTAHFEKREVDGHPVFVPVGLEGTDALESGIENPYAAFPQLARRASVEGTEAVDGRLSWILAVDDFSGLDLGGAVPRERGEFVPTRGTFWLDREDHVLTKMWMEGELRRDGEAAPVSMEARFSDYRTVQGLMHPFRMTVRADGFADAGLSPEERAQARESLRELRGQMEAMPEGQRKMMEGMLRGQLEQLEQLVESGTLEFTATVKELKVNTGTLPGADSGAGR